MACFTGNNVTFTTKLLDVTWPDYTRILPGEPAYSIKLEKAALADAIAHLLPFAGDKGLVLRFEGGVCRVVAADKNRKALAELECPDDLPFELRVQPRYLQDALSKLEAGQVQLDFTKQGDPVILRDTRPERLHLVMPRNF